MGVNPSVIRESFMDTDIYGERNKLAELPPGAQKPCRSCGCAGWMRLPNGEALPPKHADDCVRSPSQK
jgi:hypothetical protein